jgi:hypothetical protein
MAREVAVHRFHKGQCILPPLMSGCCFNELRDRRERRGIGCHARNNGGGPEPDLRDDVSP